MDSPAASPILGVGQPQEVPIADIHVPLGDVLRAPYSYTFPVVVAQRPVIAGWIVAGIAFALLLLTLLLDAFVFARRRMAHPDRSARPLEHSH